MRALKVTTVVVLILAEAAIFAFGDALAARTKGTVQTVIVVVTAIVVVAFLAWVARTSPGSND